MFFCLKIASLFLVMHTTKIILRRASGQICTVQGILWAARTGFFQTIQNDLNREVRQGSRVFYECETDTRKPPASYSIEERQIVTFMRHYGRLCRLIYEAQGLALAYNHLRMPGTVVDANLPFAKMISMLCQRGFHKTKFFKEMGAALKDRKLCRLAVEVSRQVKFRPIVSTDTVFDKFDLNVAHDAFKEVLNRGKHEAAAESISRNLNGSNAYVVYRTIHVPGIAELLMNDGWQFVSETKTNY